MHAHIVITREKSDIVSFDESMRLVGVLMSRCVNARTRKKEKCKKNEKSNDRSYRCDEKRREKRERKKENETAASLD
jgi:hypothetical protein